MNSDVKTVVWEDVMALVNMVAQVVEEAVTLPVKVLAQINALDAGVDVVVLVRTHVRINVIEDNP